MRGAGIAVIATAGDRRSGSARWSRARNTGTGIGRSFPVRDAWARDGSAGGASVRVGDSEDFMPRTTGRTAGGRSGCAFARSGLVGTDRSGRMEGSARWIGRGAEGEDSVGRSRSGRSRSGRDCSGRDCSGRDCSGRDRSGRDRSGRDRSGRDCSGRDVAPGCARLGRSGRVGGSGAGSRGRSAASSTAAGAASDADTGWRFSEGRHRCKRIGRDADPSPADGRAAPRGSTSIFSSGRASAGRICDVTGRPADAPRSRRASGSARSRRTGALRRVAPGGRKTGGARRAAGREDGGRGTARRGTAAC